MLWIDIPFVAQEKEGCGAASIAMVMQYWDARGYASVDSVMDADQIMERLYSRADEGIRAEDVDRYFRDNGFRTFLFSGNSQDVAHHIQRGRPLIVALKAKGRDGLHYLVIAGIDLQDKLILVNDPSERKLLKMDQNEFEKRWRATENWTLLALPISNEQ